MRQIIHLSREFLNETASLRWILPEHEYVQLWIDTRMQEAYVYGKSWIIEQVSLILELKRKTNVELRFISRCKGGKNSARTRRTDVLSSLQCSIEWIHLHAGKLSRFVYNLRSYSFYLKRYLFWLLNVYQIKILKKKFFKSGIVCIYPWTILHQTNFTRLLPMAVMFSAKFFSRWEPSMVFIDSISILGYRTTLIFYKI